MKVLTKLNNQKGLSLIEVMLSGAIFSGLLVFYLNFQSNMTDLGGLAKKRMAELLLKEKLISELKNPLTCSFALTNSPSNPNVNGVIYPSTDNYTNSFPRMFGQGGKVILDNNELLFDNLIRVENIQLRSHDFLTFSQINHQNHQYPVVKLAVQYSLFRQAGITDELIVELYTDTGNPGDTITTCSSVKGNLDIQDLTLRRPASTGDPNPGQSMTLATEDGYLNFMNSTLLINTRFGTASNFLRFNGSPTVNLSNVDIRCPGKPTNLDGDLTITPGDGTYDFSSSGNLEPNPTGLLAPVNGCFGSAALPVAGDANGDGVINFSDAVALLFAFGDLGGPYDINSDGVVNFSDSVALLFSFGPAPTTF